MKIIDTDTRCVLTEKKFGEKTIFADFLFVHTQDHFKFVFRIQGTQYEILGSDFEDMVHKLNEQFNIRATKRIFNGLPIRIE